MWAATTPHPDTAHIWRRVRELNPRRRLATDAPVFGTGDFASSSNSPNLVDTEGIEPSTLGCGPSVFPLAPRAQTGAGRVTRKPTLRFTGPLLCRLSYTGIKIKSPRFLGGFGYVSMFASSHTRTPSRVGAAAVGDDGDVKRIICDDSIMSVK